PTPIIEWSKTEGKLPQRTTIENYGKLLIITNVTGDDNGKYMCKAKNSAGESTHLFDIAIE
ncbi:neural cell adhesion molecule L1-like protein isoform X1, partial [Clarias magur]